MEQREFHSCWWECNMAPPFGNLSGSFLQAYAYHMPSNCIPRYLSRKNKEIYPCKILCTNVCSGFIYKQQNLGTVLVSISWWVDQHTWAHPNPGLWWKPWGTGIWSAGHKDPPSSMQHDAIGIKHLCHIWFPVRLKTGGTPVVCRGLEEGWPQRKRRHAWVWTVAWLWWLHDCWRLLKFRKLCTEKE